ncbi:OmpH family outer membrane protein [Novosphingobium terrae]|jgi:Skp family chaperone for outer membrane proteins|uniref:OmpH family outer membrane protein n=1 Tax=Novosphingobium terrae TaxID=2726189 RepID=UPI00197D2976|nr:OmpH family outer membrane protein [Novosphingobium terrae]
MKMLVKSFVAVALLAGTAQAALAAPKPAAAAPAAAPAAAGVKAGVNGIAFAYLDAIIENSAANRAADAQRPTTYKAQIDQAEARRKQLVAQIQPMVDKYNKDAAAPGANAAAIQQQGETIQKLQESGQQELQKILEPVNLSRAYVREQILDKLDASIQAAMQKNGVTLLLDPRAKLASSNAYDLSRAILTEVDAAIPNAQLVPPAGWLPREVREQQAQQQQAAAAAGGAAPAAGRPDAGGGR